MFMALIHPLVSWKLEVNIHFNLGFAMYLRTLLYCLYICLYYCPSGLAQGAQSFIDLNEGIYRGNVRIVELIE